jgi:putative aldouronate transport system substrate-binding protein
MKKLVSLVLATAMVLSLASFAPAAASEAPVKLTWFVDVPSFNFNSEGWGLDRMTAEFTEKFGIEIEFVTAADESGSQLATLISSDSVPDIITVKGLWDAPSTSLIRQMAEAGMLSSYNDLMDQYLTDAEKANFRSDVLAWYALSDGKTYAYPNYAYSTDDLTEGVGLIPNRGIVVRKDLWEEIGSPDMSTAEGFLNACEAASKLTYNDLPVIGMQLFEQGNEAENIISQYFAVPWETPDGHTYSPWTNGANKDSYAFLNEAFRRGLILESNYSDTRDQVREKIANGRVFALVAAPQDFYPQFQSLYDTDPNAYYIATEVRNANGDEPVLTDISGWGYLQTFISAGCKAPEQLIKFISYLLSPEGAIHLAYGWEGEQWAWNEDGSISATDEFIAAQNADATLRKKLGIGCFDLFANWAFLMQLQPPLDPENPDQLKTLLTNNNYIMLPLAKYSYRAAQYKYDPNDDRALTVNEENVKAQSYLNIAVAELLTAPTADAFDAKYTEIQQVLPTMYDMALVLAYNDDALQAGKAQLGVKFFWPPYAAQK